jgi:hypothetical protein
MSSNKTFHDFLQFEFARRIIRTPPQNTRVRDWNLCKTDHNRVVRANEVVVA